MRPLESASLCGLYVYIVCLVLVLQAGVFAQAGSPAVNVTVVSDPVQRPASTRCDPFGASARYDESLDFARRVRVLRFNSCPNHFSECQTSDCADNATYATEQWKTLEIPLYPGMARLEDVISVRCSSDSNDIVAVALNGVPFRSNSDALDTPPVCVYPQDYLPQNGKSSECDLNGLGDGSRYCGDHVGRTAATFDKCGGHADARDGLYHYHVPPSCLLNGLPRLPDTGGHSAQLGWALDGFPVYGPRGPNGMVMQPCRPGDPTSTAGSSQFCLDDCNGFYGELPGVDSYLYRYYVSGDVADDECSPTVAMGSNVTVPCDRREDPCCASVVPSSSSFSPFTLACFRGCPVGYGDIGKCRYRDDIKSTTDTFYPELSNFGLDAFKTPIAVDGAPTTPTMLPTRAPETTHAPTQPSDTHAPISQLVPSILIRRGIDGYRSLVLETGDPSGNSGDNTSDVKFVSNFNVGLAFDGGSGTLFYATQEDVRAASAKPSNLDSPSESIIGGMTDITVYGSDFGDEPCRVQVREVDCTSVRFIAPNVLSCRTVAQVVATSMEPISVFRSSHTIEIIDVNDVVVSCSTGTMRGIHLEPETVSRSRARRLVVSQIAIKRTPILPYAISIAPARARKEGLLFWSDIGREARCIYRSALDGSEPRVVLSNVNEVYSLFHQLRFGSSGDEGCSADPLVAASAPLSALGAARRDALFYIDADRSYLLDPSGQMRSQRWGVVGLVFVENAHDSGPALHDGAPSSLRADGLFTCNIYAGSCHQTSSEVMSTGIEYSLFELSPTPDRDLVLVDGLDNPRSVTFDPTSGFLFIVTRNGLVVRIDVAEALVHYQSLRGLSMCVPDSDLPEVLRGKCFRPVVNIDRYLKEIHNTRGVSNLRALAADLLPSWLAVFPPSQSDSRSRFMHAALIPSSYFAEGANMRSRRDRSLILVDTALNRIHFTDAFGARHVYLDLLRESSGFGERHRVFWPVAAQVGEINNDALTLYVSEYFGSIWRIEVNASALADDGVGGGIARQPARPGTAVSRQLSLLSAPTLLSGAGQGSAEQQRLRSLLLPSAHELEEEGTERGSANRKRKVFFEALN